MELSVLFACMILLAASAFGIGRSRSLRLADRKSLNSLPHYYGLLACIWASLPALVVLGVWMIFSEGMIHSLVLKQLPPEFIELPEAEQGLIMTQIYSLAYDQRGLVAPDFMLFAAEKLVALQEADRWLRSTAVILLMALAILVAHRIIRPEMKARDRVEVYFRRFLMVCSLVAVATTLGILLSVFFESLSFFESVPFSEFMFGKTWSPQQSFDESRGQFGALPLFLGTLFVAFIAMLVAAPTGLMSAIYLSEYAPGRVRAIVKPLLEILAGVPTVVYGFFAAIVVAPAVRDFAIFLGLDAWMTVSSESALACGLVLGFMILPFISSLSDDVLRAVPQSVRDGALGLGATQSEMIRHVVFPAAFPGVVAGILLAASRAIGETMIVLMVAGLVANLTINPLDSVTTVTAQIVTLLVGDQSFDSPKTRAAFALGLMLFACTLLLNYYALYVVRKYRERY
jgi:phosphate transport system permease protein